MQKKYNQEESGRRKWNDLTKNTDLIVFLDSELDSESDEAENYRYEHKYETLI